MHFLYLAPEHPAPHRDFVRALKAVGLRVSGIGHAPRSRLDDELRSLLDDYEGVGSLFDPAQLAQAAQKIDGRKSVDRVEATDETLTLPAAQLRETLQLPGTSVRTAHLCRDKTAMKEVLRVGGVACAASAAVETVDQVRRFVEQEGLPVILKPITGFGSQKTFRAETRKDLERAIAELKIGQGGSAAIEEFVVGHEGFYDTVAVDGKVAVDFICHYYPNVLTALQNREISPQIAATNRVDAESYDAVKQMGRKVIQLLGIETSATHMEWFFGPKGLKFSEIGARPPGERLWDLHCAGNQMDLYEEWAWLMSRGTASQKPSRAFATGSIQVRSDQDGVIRSYRGLRDIWRECGPWIFQSQIPKPGTPTRPVRLGYLENTWFRLRHPNYDQLLRMMDFIADTLKVHATAQ